MMRRTRLGVLLIAVGASLFPLALVLRTPAPALAGALLIALTLAQAPPSVDVRARREAPARVVAGEPFEVVTTAEETGGAAILVDERAPEGVEVLGVTREVGAGRCTLRTRAVASGPGVLLWQGVRVRFQDPWGVSEDEVRLGLATALQVAPDKDALLKGRLAGRSLKGATRVKSTRGHEREPEVERLRDFQPGDRLRDIAWTQVAKLGRLITRELRRETVLPVVILLQATPTMRRARRASKLATCARAALAVAAAAETRGVGVGLVAWSEQGVSAQVRVASGRRALSEAMLRLAQLPPALPYVAPPPPRAAPDAPHPLTHEERAFLAAAASFGGVASGLTPTEAALAALTRVATQPSMVVAFLDAEESPEMAGAMLARLRAHGHRVVLVSPASGAHTYARAEVDEPALQQLLLWRRNRAAAEGTARRHGAPFIVLSPGLTSADVQEVVRSAA